VAGAAAVFLQDHPLAKPAQVRDEILRRAVTVAGLTKRMLRVN
jgi:hypothetical protein